MKLKAQSGWHCQLLLALSILGVAHAHPLDPLNANEIRSTVAILQNGHKVTANTCYSVVTLQEPDKASVLAGAAVDRKAMVVVCDRPHNQTWRGVVNLTRHQVESWDEVPDVQPAQLPDEEALVGKLIRKDPRFVQAMARRGIRHLDEIQYDTWVPGYREPSDGPGRRLARVLFDNRGHGTNPYTQPIEGVVALVDLNHMQVLEVSDTGVRPVQPVRGSLDPTSIRHHFGALRPAPRPFTITQRLGPDFQLQGHAIDWQKWHLRWAMHPREGLVLYNVGYRDGGRIRSILYRASLSEMVVPYGDPDPNWSFRNAFDVGEYGVGYLADSLTPGQDVPENAVLLGATFSDMHGRPVVTPRCVAIYETDGGMLWKHFDYETQHNETRRGRKLVISMVATVSNYDYSYNWIFSQDGSIEFKTVATGIDLSKGVDTPRCACRGTEKGVDERYGTLVAPHVVAPNHQHWFNMRLDFDVDGSDNSVWEMNVHSQPAGPDNPYRDAFVADDTVLASPRTAGRDLNLETQRSWLVVNPNKRNALGQPTAYMLMPGSNSVPYLQPESPIRKRAGFIDHHFWVTRFDPSQMYAGGDFPNQRPGADGVSVWSQDDRSIENTDVVVWYTFGITHIPRPEDYPVMAQTEAGFKLLPVGFFDHEPALDVPPDH